MLVLVMGTLRENLFHPHFLTSDGCWKSLNLLASSDITPVSAYIIMQCSLYVCIYLSEFPPPYKDNGNHPPPTIQETTIHMAITRWSILKWYWLHSLQQKMEKFYTSPKYSQPKQDRELRVAQIINSLLQNSDLNWRK